MSNYVITTARAHRSAARFLLLSCGSGCLARRGGGVTVRHCVMMYTVLHGRRMKGKCRSVNRNCCLGIWNLYFVFQFPNCRARRVSWILHGDIWILKSVQVPKSAARRVIWNLDLARAGSWKLFKYSQNARVVDGLLGSDGDGGCSIEGG